jgi:uncharacterized protein DUF4345
VTDSTPRRSIWFGRFVLAAATLLMIRIGVEYLTDPVGAVAPRGITLASAEAVTMMRVSGGVFLAMAIAFAVSLASARRLLAGLGLLAIFAWTLTVVRLIGLAVDGPAPFTLKVLKPEVALVVLSSAAFVLLRRRGTRESAQLTSTRTPATSPNA